MSVLAQREPVPESASFDDRERFDRLVPLQLNADIPFFRQEQLPVFTTVSSPLVAAFHSSGYKDAQGNESWWWGDQLAGKKIEANHDFTQRVPG